MFYMLKTVSMIEVLLKLGILSTFNYCMTAPVETSGLPLSGLPCINISKGAFIIYGVGGS
jgi:hypothetical protein